MTRSTLKFPLWVPPEARKEIERIRATALRPQLRSIVDRLATDWRMEIVWKEVARHGPEKEANVMRHAFVRAQQALEYRPPASRRKKDQYAHTVAAVAAPREPSAQIYSLRNVAWDASKLVQVMRDTDSQAKAFGLAPEEFQNLLDSAQQIASVYTTLSAQQKALERLWSLPPIGKAAAPGARERLFSAALSDDFRFLFGLPLDEAVAALIAVVFYSDKSSSDKSPGSEIVRGRRRSAAKRRNILSKN
jgi:hypothetical protein